MKKKSVFRSTAVAGVLILSFMLICWNGISSAVPENTTRLGVWITVFSPEKVLTSRENVDRLIKICKKCGISDIYIQVYRADKAYYDSAVTDRTPYEKMLSETKEDMLEYLIDSAQKNGSKVHAWINLLSIAQNKNANILKEFGNGILTIDQHGRTSMPEGKKDELDRYYIRENQLFLEPGDERVRKYLAGIAEEVVRRYPGLSGLHLDYIRYPMVVPFIPGSRFTSHGISYGYGKTALKGFKDTTGLDPVVMENSRGNFALWDEWRREQVTSLLRDISGRVRSVRPSMEISCTIAPSVERTYLVLFQDWTAWLKKGYADHVVVMDYTDDSKLMKLNAGAMLLPDLKDRVHIGIGAYLLKGKPGKLREQFTSLTELSPAGIIVFSYDEVAKDEAFQEFLAGLRPS